MTAVKSFGPPVQFTLEWVFRVVNLMRRSDQKDKPSAGLPPIPTPARRSKRPGLGQAIKAVAEDEKRRELDEIILAQLPLVRRIATRVHENLPVKV